MWRAFMLLRRAAGSVSSGKNASVPRLSDLCQNRPLGPAYSQSNASFAAGSHLTRAPFFTDEAYDYLSSGLWPYRTVHRKVNRRSERQRKFRDFAVAARRSFMVSEERESNGRRTISHVVQAGRGDETTGSRDAVYGTRVVPPASDWDDIIAWVRRYPKIVYPHQHDLYFSIRLLWI